MSQRVFSQEEVTAHFDTLAKGYDEGKKRNNTYYLALIKILQECIPKNRRVLEIGCGTGDILTSLMPTCGVGIDTSSKMIEKCELKYPEGTWIHCNIEDFTRTNPDPFEVIVMADLVEHVADLPALFSHLSEISKPGTSLVISFANPLWKPALFMLEKMHLKLPEGPHYRPSCRGIRGMLSPHGFTFESKRFTLLIPREIPLISAVTSQLERLPLLHRLCVIEILEFTYRGE